MVENTGGDRHVEIWKIKKLITKLESCKGYNTSMVTLDIPPRDDIN
jgi:peptide chain release factor subunit 1